MPHSKLSLFFILSGFLLISCATKLTVAPPPYESAPSPSMGVNSLTSTLPASDQDLRVMGIDRWSGKEITPYNDEAFARVLAYGLVSLDVDTMGEEGYSQPPSDFAALTLYGRMTPRDHTGFLKPVYLDGEGWNALDSLIRGTFQEDSEAEISVAVETSLWYDTFQTNRTMDSNLIDSRGTVFCIGQSALIFTSPSGEMEKNIYAFAEREFSTTWSTEPSEELLAELYGEVLDKLRDELQIITGEIRTGLAEVE